MQLATHEFEYWYPRLGNIKYWISVSSMLSAHLDWELMKSQSNCSPTEVAQSHHSVLTGVKSGPIATLVLAERLKHFCLIHLAQITYMRFGVL
jgi:hypothetical protein